jgi:hypothetical protein
MKYLFLVSQWTSIPVSELLRMNVDRLSHEDPNEETIIVDEDNEKRDNSQFTGGDNDASPPQRMSKRMKPS